MSVERGAMKSLSTVTLLGLLDNEDGSTMIFRNVGKVIFFYVLLTVHLSIILVFNQLDAQNLMFIGPCIIAVVDE